MSDEREQRYFQSMYRAFDDEDLDLYTPDEIDMAYHRWWDVFSGIRVESEWLRIFSHTEYHLTHTVHGDDRMELHIMCKGTDGRYQTLKLTLPVKFFCDVDTSAIRAYLQEARQRLDAGNPE